MNMMCVANLAISISNVRCGNCIVQTVLKIIDELLLQRLLYALANGQCAVHYPNRKGKKKQDTNIETN
jgi:hypothetical protein